jgi:N-acetylglutamate synthase
MSSVTLRPLLIADYDAVYALWSATEGMGLGESDTREAIAFFLQRNPGLSHVATVTTGQIVAAVLCGHDGRRGYLHHLAVAQQYRKRGLGRQLVNHCLELLLAGGIGRCNIFLLADNIEGRVFWVREGWKVREDVRLVQKLIDPSIVDD